MSNVGHLRINTSIIIGYLQVWRTALEEEFNITHLSDISSDTYYEIWHTKYSEPAQLITKNNQMTLDALNHLLANYKLGNRYKDNFTSKIDNTIN